MRGFFALRLLTVMVAFCVSTISYAGTVTRIDVAGRPDAYSSSLVTVLFDRPVTRNDARELYLAAGPTGEALYCDKFYAFFDQQGEFDLQHKCGGSTAPWGFHISPKLRPTVVGLVSETGMEWTKNGVKQPKMAPHQEWPNYNFHGNFSGSPDGTAITYDDHFTFRHNIGPGGDADIHVFGSFTLTGNRPPPPPPECRPGKPC